MSSKKNKKLTDAELQYFAENLDEISSPDELSTASGESSSEEDPFHKSGESDESYKPSSSSDEDIQNDNSDTEEEEGNITAENSGEQFEIPAMNGNVIWSLPTKDAHIPRFSIPDEIQCAVDPSITANSTPLEIFNKLFPRSLFIFIAKCTNQRIQMYNRNNKSATLTDAGEIMITLGCSLVMCYNKVPNLRHYWSSHPSLGNKAIKSAISKNRCLFLLSKLYFNDPKKPEGSSKIYYVQELISCFKYTFQKYRSDSSRQSIDESMVGFKGRSSLKQYMPQKPVKRGIKLWCRCDAKTGYTYDTNVYCGKEDVERCGTLGETVVKKLCETIRNPNVVLAFDRFFTSVHLMDYLQYPAVGTAILTRKDMPKKFKEKRKMNRGECEFLTNQSSSLATRWQDTKEVIVLSNCHSTVMTSVKRKDKSGKKVDVPCPTAIAFYNEIMGGVDLADQMSGVYNLDRKSCKWWKKKI
ncbi:unnamed protein product [Acanthoscelides obtectus]|uniref:PiggyBac transposable element-derived protein domain-containing protein n=1 Tax=Acanthoscelides obtectus TaxID=200917 RepID=A0A9P0Q6D9_ACAOB|nr:unnamed protein product [Acanthoscelides obtectus]CAK1640847.1 PiggyBac transposable element-derived protein 4 [Acanthoscelides obtectus]